MKKCIKELLSVALIAGATVQTTIPRERHEGNRSGYEGRIRESQELNRVNKYELQRRTADLEVGLAIDLAILAGKGVVEVGKIASKAAEAAAKKLGLRVDVPVTNNSNFPIKVAVKRSWVGALGISGNYVTIADKRDPHNSYTFTNEPGNEVKIKVMIDGREVVKTHRKSIGRVGIQVDVDPTGATDDDKIKVTESGL